ncbi:RnfH family protein [Dokdonella koreensis]|jgi:putative ubiquitin-RnfH superfamily antitoxin RatB of RatAB toxin-antitoxin module|uniref:UPF0125 protein I596_2553 n=1 Tax=Dokdonella koreensis DS-123 TaxID=1300342 RepID=A0A167H201_9GAMM|nr:RnfH family protein [Dokdonella koreensis]ANB18556.1 Protein RnfH [Dokdonella koreensis DS-123]
MAEPSIRVEIAYADAAHQFLAEHRFAAGTTLAQALEASEVDRICRITWRTLAVGVWSRQAAPDTVLADGDRIEIYRPLKADPKDARRRRAAKGKPPRQP